MLQAQSDEPTAQARQRGGLKLADPIEIGERPQAVTVSIIPPHANQQIAAINPAARNVATRTRGPCLRPQADRQRQRNVDQARHRALLIETVLVLSMHSPRSRCGAGATVYLRQQTEQMVQLLDWLLRCA